MLAGCACCYEIWIGEGQAVPMKKDKEVREERSVYSADSYLACLFIYQWRSRGVKYRELYHTSSLAGILPDAMSLPNTHCVTTH